MPTIQNAQLSVSPEQSLTRATLTVRCDVQFTDFEVEAMNKLGVRYQLGCRVVNKDLWYETTSVEFAAIELPLNGGPAIACEHVEFRMVAPVDQLQEHMFTRDEFHAALTLQDSESGAEQVERSPLIRVDLAA